MSLSPAIVVVLAAGYVAGWALSPLPSGSALSDLDLYFWPSAEMAAHGHPLMAYSAHTLDVYPNASGPLGLLFLSPLAAIANALGWAGDVRVHAGMVGVVGALCSLLLAKELIRLMEAQRGPLDWRLAASSLILLSPVLWMTLAEYGHLEQIVEVYLVVLGARLSLRDARLSAGVAAGLAVLARTTAILYIVPLALVGTVRGRLRGGAVTAGGLVATVGLGLAPFLAVDATHVVHSLVTYRGDLPIAGGSVLIVFRGVGTGLFQHSDSLIVIAVSSALCAWVVRRQPDVARSSAGVFGLLCISTACFAMLAKTVYPYYLFEPYAFSLVWWLARPDAGLTWRSLVPLVLTLDAFLTNWGIRLPFTGMGVVEGVVSSGLLALAVGMIAADLARRPRRESSVPDRLSPPLRAKAGTVT